MSKEQSIEAANRLARTIDTRPRTLTWLPMVQGFAVSANDFHRHAHTPSERSSPMSDSSAVPATTDWIAELLAAHAPSHQVDGDYGEYQWVECICDSDYFEDTDAGIAEHRAHVASLLAVLVADAQTDAWEEGARHRNNALGHKDNGECFRVCNPYRKVSDSGESEKLQQQPNAPEGEEHAGSDKVVGTHTPHNTPEGNQNE